MKENRNEQPCAGTVLEIQRMSTEDGPGIRTTVFMKGCPLSCTWCHNPESISPKPQVHWMETRCIGCGICVDTCPEGALSFAESGIRINRKLCRGCGRCADACPSTAMELLGKKWRADKLAQELVKDRAFFENSGGGITISGGESTMQKEFVTELLKILNSRGINTAIDTCGVCSKKVLDAILPHANLVLFDIKLMDSALHRKYTGSGNEQILENLAHAAELVGRHLHPEALWIRTPIIPGATDSADNIRGIGRFLAGLCQGVVTRWELCAFNNLCADKYARLDRNWDFEATPLVSEETMEHLAEIARASGVDPAIVSWTGSARDTSAADEKPEHRFDLSGQSKEAER